MYSWCYFCKLLFSMMYLGLFLILCINGVKSSIGGSPWSPQPDVCDSSVPKGRVPWILHVRDSNYGWGEHTHRAMIALAVNDYTGKNDEMRKMVLQLEVELTKALFFNKTSPMHDSDLALYIHALLANNKNPRNFHGIDLVADLLYRVQSATGQVNPFLILALCNAHVLEYEHLEKLSEIVHRTHPSDFNPNVHHHPDVDSREAQLKALAYKAFACAAKQRLPVHKFNEEKKLITECLHRKYNQTTGSFGNIYTTALAVQAFNAVKPAPNWWDESKSESVLLEEAEIDVNLIKAYYIEMALNSKKYHFIRDLYEGVPLPAQTASIQDSHYVTYTIKESRLPDKYFTLTINVQKGSNFYDIMKMASNASDVFKFTSYTNNNGEPMVYSVSGIPNDVEENMFWRLCKESNVNHNYHTSLVQDFDESPVRLVPNAQDHFTYLYSNGACPK